jgi:hypothetical protein
MDERYHTHPELSFADRGGRAAFDLLSSLTEA